jgi:hypothetical protein
MAYIFSYHLSTLKFATLSNIEYGIGNDGNEIDWQQSTSRLVEMMIRIAQHLCRL